MQLSQTKIGFVFYSQLHHLPHFVGIAVALSKKENTHVEILTYKSDQTYLNEVIHQLDGHKVVVNEFTSVLTRFASKKGSVINWFDWNIYLIYIKYLRYFLKFDALVFTSMSTVFFAFPCRKKLPKLINVFHGAGDRAYGFKKSIAKYDFLLLSGKKIKNRLEKENKLPKNKACKIVGYPKFDLVKKVNSALSLFNNTNPVFLYNPHFKPELSSWNRMGLDVLDFFYAHPEYNLIFAPHLDLFKNERDKNNALLNKYNMLPTIHIDTGSIRSVDMAYTLAADAYIGDVSSQIYEFLLKPRPAFFLNAHGVEWQNNPDYLHWKTGEVLTDIIQLESLLVNRDAVWKAKYEKVQTELLAETFDIDPKKEASERAADAIHEFLKQ